MDMFWIFYATSCFLFFAIGRMFGVNKGYNVGKAAMKQAITKDIQMYPTKWKNYIEQHEEFNRE
jgi:hypothetical protein